MTESSLLLLFLLSLSALSFFVCRAFFGDLDDILPEAPKKEPAAAKKKTTRKKRASKKKASKRKKKS